jgi:hypothetical protein
VLVPVAVAVLDAVAVGVAVAVVVLVAVEVEVAVFVAVAVAVFVAVAVAVLVVVAEAVLVAVAVAVDVSVGVAVAVDVGVAVAVAVDVGVAVAVDTVVRAVELLFPEFGSGVSDPIEAVLLIIVPDGVPGFTWTIIMKTTEVKGAIDAVEHVTVPVPPTGGVMHNHPATGSRNWKVVFAGILSVSVAFTAAFGPKLAILIA